ncbi:alkaline phosphatase family protein [Salinibacillus xinjiangensis]|uniref:Alkaline phosphatase family protein n=1 Tax=Salinibacillus xinjiangensis TaxID=1229268 RepID=A0A6G1X4B2_9BACI|nr:alkaline phosphatase family protein [Salinibacillus xinjiangensis]MRG85787.1 hypothetical protein [Salinibacillus xinjiangensis]
MTNPRTSIHKPVILLAIDTLMSTPLEVVAQTGRAPALQFLMENGQYIPNLVSSFPTMSVTIDSSLLTGTYADQHHIPGLNWFDISKKSIVNYGTGLRETYRLGWKKVATNTLNRLNNEHLSENVTTIYEDLADMGISSGSINALVYRGNNPKRLQVPRLLSAFTEFENGEWTTNATSTFSLGTFSKLRPWSFPTKVVAGNYKYIVREMKYLIKKEQLPAFTLCLFQDLDTRIHFKGPMDVKGLIKIDREIQKLLNLYPSWEDALKQNIWMVIGDNGHSATGFDYEKYIIDLRKILSHYRIARIEKPVRTKDELVLCVNQRMAYVYLLDDDMQISQITDDLKKDSRIDVIAWKDDSWVHVVSGKNQGKLRFTKGGHDVDEYSQSWTIEGNGELLDLKISEDGKIFYGDYPDALARLYGALHSHSGRFIVVNAKPGCDFKAQSTPFHLSGAAHGSLHRQETLIPLIITGTKQTPSTPRIVDMKAFILQLIHQQIEENTHVKD